MSGKSGYDFPFFTLQEIASYKEKPFGQDRTAAERNYIAEATRHRRRGCEKSLSRGFEDQGFT